MARARRLRCRPHPADSHEFMCPDKSRGHMANHEQADRLANAVRSRLLTPGGILASEYETGEQWDKPNGWAPLQWMAIQGFKMYGDDLLGDEIARSWLKTVNQFYLEQHKLIEKYHIADGVPREGGGGESDRFDVAQHDRRDLTHQGVGHGDLGGGHRASVAGRQPPVLPPEAVPAVASPAAPVAPEPASTGSSRP